MSRIKAIPTVKGDALFVICRGLLLLAVIIFCCTGSGCGNRAAKLDRLEEDSPLIRKAMEKKRFGDEDAAIELYGKALEKEPALARAHLELGFLLDSPTRDYVLAIYHYRSYLDLRPGTDKKEMIEDRIRMAKLALAASLSPQTSTGAERMMALEKENATLRQENDYLRNEVHDLRDHLQTASSNDVVSTLPIFGGGTRSSDLTLVAPVSVATARTVKVSTITHPISTNTGGTTLSQKSTGSASGSSSESAGTKSVRSSTTRTGGGTLKTSSGTRVRVYRVKKNDNLHSIAAKVYGDSHRWRDIYMANRASMHHENDLKVGQTLRIPP